MNWKSCRRGAASAEPALELFRDGAVGAYLGGGRDDRAAFWAPLGDDDNAGRDQGHVPEEQVGEVVGGAGLPPDVVAEVSAAYPLLHALWVVLRGAVGGDQVAPVREGRLEGGDDGCR